MKRRNIALIGFRATGKSTVGEVLASDLGLEFLDMDRHLVLNAGRDIAEWVKQKGWESFRQAESDLLVRISARSGLVVATGGGIVLEEQSRRALREKFFTVWLKAAPATIFARLSSDPGSPATRPPLSNLPMEEEIMKVLLDREPLYAETALHRIDTEGKTPVVIAGEISILYRQAHC
jgi:shikimate kinase